MVKVRSSPPYVFSAKGALKICSKFRGEQTCQSVISIKLLEITLRRGYSPANLLHIFRTPFPENTSGELLLNLTKNDLLIAKIRQIPFWDIQKGFSRKSN